MPPGLVIAPQLPDLLLPVAIRRGVLGFLRNHPTVAIGGALLLCLVLVGIFAPWLGTVDPTALAPAKRTRSPSADFWFGTDVLGRDIYSRVLYGARVSLTVGLSVARTGLARRSRDRPRLGFRAMGGRHRHAVHGRADVDTADPARRRADGVDTRQRRQRHPGHHGCRNPARLASGAQRRASRCASSPMWMPPSASGTRTPMIILRHILPNTLAPMLVQATYICASAMIVESILSFIGAGTPPTIPSWGNIMAEGRALWQVKPYIVFFPAAFLSVTVLAVNLLGDGLRDALDPRMAKSL